MSWYWGKFDKFPPISWHIWSVQTFCGSVWLANLLPMIAVPLVWHYILLSLIFLNGSSWNITCPCPGVHVYNEQLNRLCGSFVHLFSQLMVTHNCSPPCLTLHSKVYFFLTWGAKFKYSKLPLFSRFSIEVVYVQ